MLVFLNRNCCGLRHMLVEPKAKSIREYSNYHEAYGLSTEMGYDFFDNFSDYSIYASVEPMHDKIEISEGEPPLSWSIDEQKIIDFDSMLSHTYALMMNKMNFKERIYEMIYPVSIPLSLILYEIITRHAGIDIVY